MSRRRRDTFWMRAVWSLFPGGRSLSRRALTVAIT